ncbi:MAG: DUF5658 family protein, partial [Steroidobacteraceae bacterium]
CSAGEVGIGASRRMMGRLGLQTMIQPAERRRGPDRRNRALHSLIAGHFNLRRRGPRRARDGSIASTDWYEPRWMLVAVLILLLSMTDAVLTLTLIQRGALEENPVMALLVNGSAGGFAAVKIGLTATGVILLTLVARVKAFGRVPVGVLLYGVLATYAVLVAYELSLLRALVNS